MRFAAFVVSPPMVAAAVGIAVLLLAAGCSGDGTSPAASAGAGAALAAEAGPAATADGRFDPEAAAALLAEARKAEREARIDDALDLYRRAGLAWPDTLAAWEELAALADRAGRPAEARAARFMAERVELYPGDQLFAQRDVARALRRYVDAGRVDPETNDRQLAYAETLADYYEARYAERGQYQPLEPMFNLEPYEYPTAILTGVGGAIYLGTVAAGD